MAARVSFDFLSLEEIANPQYLELNREAYHQLKEGVCFYIVEPFQKLGMVCYDNLKHMVVVLESGVALPYRLLELLTGQIFLRSSVVVSKENARFWNVYQDQNKSKSYADFNKWLTGIYQEQFLNFLSLQNDEYYAFRLSFLAHAGEPVTVLSRRDVPNTEDLITDDWVVSNLDGAFQCGLRVFAKMLDETLTEVPPILTSAEAVMFLINRVGLPDVQEWQQPASPVNAGSEVEVVDLNGEVSSQTIQSTHYSRREGQWYVSVSHPDPALLSPPDDPFRFTIRIPLFIGKRPDLESVRSGDGGYAYLPE